MRRATPPLVSIIVPAYNHADYLLQAVTSIVNQTHKNTEIFVINDGSTDHTDTVALKLPKKVHYIKQRNQGAPRTRNRGLRLSSGDYFMNLDADDWIEPTYVEACLDSLNTNSHAGYVYTDEIENDTTNNTKKEISWPGFDAERLLTHNYINITALIRRKHLAQGQFNESLPFWMDWDLFLGLLEKRVIGVRLPQKLLHRRILENSITAQAKQKNQYLTVLETLFLLHSELYNPETKARARAFWKEQTLIIQRNISTANFSGRVREGKAALALTRNPYQLALQALYTLSPHAYRSARQRLIR